ncbi:hypothetical protein [Nostocoides sp. Soil756]|jgi:hypothetical protein|uniref:hypothetical protein n=1 Tax=Nostocoides sp. Soil756 TaxID=1736399 RepID=UPI0006FE3DC2|nr:hypothetical protein [Tetrasphaera sp. Soil756]KRE63409.1 hypothetical protein ASG78_00385 [Tetrasphaera sp. Soil756]
MSPARRARPLTTAGFALGAALALLAGCSAGDPEPVATTPGSSPASSSPTPTAAASGAPTAAASPTASPTASPSSSAADTSTPAPTASASASAPTVAPSPAGTTAARGIPRTLELEVTSVASGCVYAEPPGTERLYALRGRVPAVAPGDLLTVSGAADDTPYPQCPDGRPFLVSTATRTG